MTDQKSKVRSKYEKYEMLLVRHKLRKTHDSVKKKKIHNTKANCQVCFVQSYWFDTLNIWHI